MIYANYHNVANAIKNLTIRCAPAIRVAEVFGLALAALQSKSKTKDAN